ncbi:MAG: hypothetical protein ACKV2T_11515 [Kofleriaceae bacterium]
MGNIRLVASSLFALITLVACGDDGGTTTLIDSGIVDAPPVDSAPPIDQPPPITYDVSCHNNAAPTDIDATVTVSGTTQSANVVAMSLGPTDGVTLTACKGDCIAGNNLGQVGPTDATGNFTTPALATNGVALDGYLKATKAQQWDTYLYPHAALAKSLNGAPVLIVNQGLVNLIGMFVDAQELGNGILGVAITDCSTTTTGVSGATISVTAGGVAVGDPAFDVGALAGDQAAGVYLITNVPPGEVIVTATYNQGGTNYTFLANNVTIYANALTTAQVRPGY